jgi:hypothetical protein
VTDFHARLVLKNTCTVSDVKFMAWERNWILLDLQAEEAGAYVDSWTTQDRRTEIHHVDDRPIGTRYITVRGGDVEVVERQVRVDCPIWSFTEALSSLRQAHNRSDTLIALYAAVLTAPAEEDDTLVDEFRTLADDTDPELRQAVVVATGYLPWGALRNMVHKMSVSDPDPHVRKNARILLRGLLVHGDG